MFLSLVRPDRISSPMTSTPAVTMALSLGAAVIILPRSFGLDGGSNGRGRRSAARRSFRQHTYQSSRQLHHFGNHQMARTGMTTQSEVITRYGRNRRFPGHCRPNPGQYPPNTDGV